MLSNKDNEHCKSASIMRWKTTTFFTIGDINKITSITNLLSQFLIKNKNNINLQSSIIKKIYI